MVIRLTAWIDKQNYDMGRYGPCPLETYGDGVNPINISINLAGALIDIRTVIPEYDPSAIHDVLFGSCQNTNSVSKINGY
jgi:hypothetical protein